tara:strand:- start:7426 stop:9762 length:2337 start_codon:yes stop_codon:yes gene_type:complete
MTVDLNTTNPLSFLQWRTYYTDIHKASELSLLYNNYLVEWKDQKVINTTTNTDYVKNIYTQFLKNINLSSLHSDVSRFLSKIDVDDIYELELAVVYFVQLIRTQLKDVSNLREEVKFSTTKNKLKSSKLGIQKYLKNFIIRLLSNNEFIKENTDTELASINAQKISNNIQINLNSYASDHFVQKIHNTDKDLILDMENRVLKEIPNVLQALSINRNGKKLKLKTNSVSSPDSILSINENFVNFERLPDRYFRGETKTLNNLKFIYEREIIKKYLANDLYHVTGNKNYATVDKLFEHLNTTNNLSQRYNPNLSLELTELKNKQIYPRQLSFNNTGVTNFHSANLSFTVNLSAFKGREYIIPDPSKYEPGVKNVGHITNSRTGEILRNVKFKQRTPLLFKSKNAPYKNTELSTSVNFYNNKILRNYGYQSKENSLDYSYTGINKKEDSISFWDDTSDQITWKNTDTYPISVLNVYPESTRLEDLLITNKTGIKLKSDIYGNDFYFIKSVYPKRYAGTSYIPAAEVVTATSTCTTAAEYYDGLFFNTLLSAISAAYYQSTGTLYTSIDNMATATSDIGVTGHTSVFDTVIVSDTTICSSGSAEGFAAPLTDYSCTTVLTDALSCGSVSAVSAIDCGSFEDHPGTSSDLVATFFTDTTIPYYSISTASIYTSSTTTYELSTTDNPTTSAVHLFDQQYIDAGEIYVRNVYTQVIEPLSTAFSSIFNKHGSSTKTNILTSSNILNFDIVENTICIQTSAETVTELYKFEDGVFKVGASSKSIIT